MLAVRSQPWFVTITDRGKVGAREDVSFQSSASAPQIRTDRAGEIVDYSIDQILVEGFYSSEYVYLRSRAQRYEPHSDFCRGCRWGVHWRELFVVNPPPDRAVTG